MTQIKNEHMSEREICQRLGKGHSKSSALKNQAITLNLVSNRKLKTTISMGLILKN